MLQDTFIPEKNYKRNITIRLDNDLLIRLDSIAVKAGISRNQIILQCIIFALNNTVYYNNE